MSNYRVTLSDGSEHIVKASTAGRAHIQAYTLDDFPCVSVVSVDAQCPADWHGQPCTRTVAHDTHSALVFEREVTWKRSLLSPSPRSEDMDD